SSVKSVRRQAARSRLLHAEEHGPDDHEAAGGLGARQARNRVSSVLPGSVWKPASSKLRLADRAAIFCLRFWWGACTVGADCMFSLCASSSVCCSTSQRVIRAFLLGNVLLPSRFSLLEELGHVPPRQRTRIYTDR